jgi:chromosomal replication initiator protein
MIFANHSRRMKEPSMAGHKSFARFVTFPENHSALLAVQDLIKNLQSGKVQRSPNPLFLHGPPGAGKSHLVSALAREIAAGAGLTVQFVTASDFRLPAFQRLEKKKLATNEAAPVPSSLVEEAQECDLLILEDLQHLPLPAAETLVQIIDHRQAHQRPMVFTAVMGPRHLAHRGLRFPARLTSRLAAGLVVALEPLKIASRQRYLEELAQRSQLALPRDIVHWLARNLTGGGRQLEGAITQLATLNKVGRQPLDLKNVTAHFSVQVDAIRPSVERIASHVGGYFRIEARQLQSRRRYHNALLPRQIGMYLARQLTALSLEQIGAYFGGRDHSTVLHACRKVEQALKKDAVLSGAVRQIHAELA